MKNPHSPAAALAILAVIGATALPGCSREDAAAAAADVRTTVGELVTPEAGNPDNMLVVRQAKLKERRRQNTTWTEENIARHPDLYLQQCKEDVRMSIDQYDASLIAFRRIRNENQRIADEAVEEIARLTRFIEEAKPYFADENTAYPVTVSGFSLTKEQLTKTLRNSIKERMRREKSVEPARRRIAVAEARIARCEKGREEAEDALRTLEDRIADVKANKALSDVSGIRSSVASVVNMAGAIPTDPDGLPVDVVGEPSAAESDEAFVRAALGL